jgi:predicted Zn finger-like uncharacterized protein
MILTCPECATRYFVGEDAVSDQGRTVRCTACGNSWRVEPETPLDLTEAHAPPRPRPAPLAPSPDLKAVELPRAFRARVEETKRVREAAATGAVWAAIIGAFALLIIGALIFRVDVVRMWPRTAGAYAAIGLPVNPFGLIIERVQAQPALQDGRAVLMVTGVVRNIRSKPSLAPALSIALLDKAGKPVAARTARVADPMVPAGGLRIFSVPLFDPPAGAATVEVVFSARAKTAAPPNHKPEPAAEKLKLRPTTEPPAPVLTPVPAAPLAPGDPNALPPADAPEMATPH